MEPIDLDFESQMEPFRGRSNTWPLPRPDVSEFSDDVKCDIEGSGGPGLTTGMIDPSVMPQTHSGHDSSSSPLEQSPMTGSSGPKKNTSRRNAWGNMSYADLITQAINGSPEKRLTLSQIYDWMVQNVPYFKDKGDSNSSAGWKNSIRHNLSLHNRFMRVQNEGTGKSSWWMINPDAKPGKAARRRATSMETQKYEKKRGRVKKKIEQLKNGLNLEQTTPSPSSSVSEGLDMFPDSPLHHTFQLSPEFRPRASSNASSCGRLSPIPAVEHDMHDSQVPPLSPLTGWNGDMARLYPSSLADVPDQYSTEQLVEMANTMKLGGNGFLTVSKNSPTGQLSPTGSHLQLNNQFGSDQLVELANPMKLGNNSFLGVNKTSATGQLSPQGSHVQLNNQCNYNLNSLAPIHSLHSNGTARTGNGSANDLIYLSQPSETGATTLTALKTVSAGTRSPSRLLAGDVIGTNGAYSQVMGHLLSLNNPLPNDLDLNFDSLQGGLECDVDSVIRHELSVDGSLDFNFDPQSQTSVAHTSTMTSAPSTRSWVH